MKLMIIRLITGISVGIFLFCLFLNPQSQSNLQYNLVQRKLHVQNTAINLPEGCPTVLNSSKVHRLSVVILLQSAQQTVITQTVYSILQHSASEHLAEIVIASDRNVAVKKMEFIIRELSPLKPQVKFAQVWGPLEGKIGNLMDIGKRLSGDSIMFIDDTTIVAERYMIPLLNALHSYPETIIVPERDELQSSLEVTNSTRTFKWTWFWDISVRLSEADETERKTPIDPVETVPFSSSAFAVTKDYLEKLMKYMKEDYLTTEFEIGLASWLCHGGVHILPCSRVAQIAIDYQRPISLETKRHIAGKFFSPKYRDLFNAHVEPYKEPGVRIFFNDNHQCTKDMDWLMQQNVVRDLFIPHEDTLYYGLMYSSGEACFRLSSTEPIFEAQPSCVAMAAKDVVEYTASRQLKIGEECLMFNQSTMYLVPSKCDISNLHQIWTYNDMKQFSNGQHCVSHASDPHEGKENRQILMAANCIPVDPRFQDWYFVQYKPMSWNNQNTK